MSDAAQSWHDLTFVDNHGQDVDLAQYAGRPVLVVNTASTAASPRSTTGCSGCTRTSRSRASS